MTNSTNQLWVITGDMYQDRDARSPMKMPIGPFESEEAAAMYIYKIHTNGVGVRRNIGREELLGHGEI